MMWYRVFLSLFLACLFSTMPTRCLAQAPIDSFRGEPIVGLWESYYDTSPGAPKCLPTSAQVRNYQSERCLQHQTFDDAAFLHVPARDLTLQAFCVVHSGYVLDAREGYEMWLVADGEAVTPRIALTVQTRGWQCVSLAGVHAAAGTAFACAWQTTKGRLHARPVSPTCVLYGE